jgi:hypothetical protein
MERVDRVSLREAARLGISRVAYAPLIRDQGNSKFGTGDVAAAFLRGVLLAYDTEKRLQKEGLANKFNLEQWNVEVGAGSSTIPLGSGEGDQGGGGHGRQAVSRPLRGRQEIGPQRRARPCRGVQRLFPFIRICVGNGL